MSLYETLINQLSNDLKNSIETRIKEWGKKHPFGQRITKNIHLEHFLPEDNMKDILLFIASEGDKRSTTFEERYQKECYRHTLMGGDIPWTEKPSYFGAAVEIMAFKSHLMANYPRKFPNQKKAEDFISHLKLGNLPRMKKNLLLKKYSIWATWNENNHEEIPFEFCNTMLADEIRANLGLDKLLISKELILFIYKMPKSIDVKRPTIADAGLSQYFEPTVPGFISHGLTRTWELEHSMIGYNLNPRPEGIHQGIEMHNLCLPISTRW
ncbi:MAG: hypothetical protein EOP00_32230 [Pedobacter sp.]|nr:MAG: hypothetical protein EOP00_32230 [Pedobacter sp.]